MVAGTIASYCPNPSLLTQESTRIQTTAQYTVETLDLSYTDASGRAFDLSIRRETALLSLTYDRSARLQSGQSGRRGRAKSPFRDLDKRLKQDLKSVARSFRGMKGEITGFKKVLHRMLKSADKAYADHYRKTDPVEARIQGFESAHAEVSAVTESLTIRMDGVDPEYWSAEQTAGRLADFARALHADEPRSEHAERMARSMEIGYRQAQRAFGGTLPGVARETVDLAKALLEQWADDTGENPGEALGLELVA
jgi:hypothetical protein